MAKGNGQTVTPQAGAVVKQEFGGSQLEVRGETAAVAVAAAQEAMVKARVILAMERPRNIERVRQRILADCERPGFADAALYSKPMGKKFNERTEKWEDNFIEGLSIRFAESMLRHMGNLFVDAMVVADDQERRIIKVVGMDLETNATSSGDVIIDKTVERQGNKNGNPPEGRVVVSERLNSWGKKTFRVLATEDELLNKTNNAVAKMRRNKILELCPADITEEAREKCEATIAALDTKDPEGQRKKLVDAFVAVGVSEQDLEKWLGRGLSALTVRDLKDLRKIHRGIKDGEMTWASVLDSRNAGEMGAPPPPPPLAQQVAATASAPAPVQPPTPAQATAAPPPAAPTQVEPPPDVKLPTGQPPAPAQPAPAGSPAEAELAQAFEATQKKGDVLKLLSKISSLPEDRRPEWRQRFNARMQELPA